MITLVKKAFEMHNARVLLANVCDKVGSADENTKTTTKFVGDDQNHVDYDLLRILKSLAKQSVNVDFLFEFA